MKFPYESTHTHARKHTLDITHGVYVRRVIGEHAVVSETVGAPIGAQSGKQ